MLRRRAAVAVGALSRARALLRAGSGVPWGQGQGRREGPPLPLWTSRAAAAHLTSAFVSRHRSIDASAVTDYLTRKGLEFKVVLHLRPADRSGRVARLLAGGRQPG
jgi:hypothetical protein